jgi:hypothetical protein
MFTGELFEEALARSREPYIGFTVPTGLSEELYMPGISTDSSIPDDTLHQIQRAHKEVSKEPDVGIIEKRYTGSVPVGIDPPGVRYKGITEFNRYHSSRGQKVFADRVGIRKGIRGREARRVSKHEFRHVKSEALLNYMGDVTPHVRTLIMESYAEFGGMQAASDEKPEIIMTTPYTPAIKFGMFVEEFYESDIDGSRGYAAFIRDIQKNRSASRTLDRLGRNIKSAINRGIDPRKETEERYRKEVENAIRHYEKAA